MGTKRATEAKPGGDKRKAERLPTLPRFEGTYTRIIVGAIAAVKQESGVTRKVRVATRELAAMVPHTRDRFRALPLIGKALVVVALLAIGSGVTYLVLRPSQLGPAELARLAQEQIAARDFSAARASLESLRELVRSRSEEERWQVIGPIEAAIELHRAELRSQIEKAREKQQWDEALALLTRLDEEGLAPEWALFNRAEILRSASRAGDSAVYYGRYVTLYPKSDRADDALFWQAAALKDSGAAESARLLFERLLNEYPTSNFRSSAKRWAAELAGPTPPASAATPK